MRDKLDPLVLELLVWIAARPRTYADAMDAWRSSCPRHTPWEDALIGGLIEVTNASGSDETQVVLTDVGRAAVKGASPPPPQGPTFDRPVFR
jgi:hypothetical protein